jgi:hypothetical protein
MRLPFITHLLMVIILLPLSGIVPVGRDGLSRITRLVTGIGLLAVIVLAGSNRWVYQYTWGTMRGIVPLAIILGLLLLARSDVELTADRRQRLLLLLASCGLCALVQYPFAAPVYFFYVAPIAVLAGLAVLSSWPGLKRLGPAAIVTFYIAFSVVRIHPGFIYQMGLRYAPYDSSHRLALSRGGLDVPAADSAIYERVTALVSEHASGGYTYSAPDAPEVYFLSGLSNPTRTQYDFFDAPLDHDKSVLQALASHDVSALVVNHGPAFSTTISPALIAQLTELYPESEDVERFTVRWRE